jgi:hypothetical protein
MKSCHTLIVLILFVLLISTIQVTYQQEQANTLTENQQNTLINSELKIPVSPKYRNKAYLSINTLRHPGYYTTKIPVKPKYRNKGFTGNRSVVLAYVPVTTQSIVQPRRRRINRGANSQFLFAHIPVFRIFRTKK